MIINSPTPFGACCAVEACLTKGAESGRRLRVFLAPSKRIRGVRDSGFFVSGGKRRTNSSEGGLWTAAGGDNNDAVSPSRLGVKGAVKRKVVLEMGGLRRACRQPGVLFILAILFLAGLAGVMGSPPPPVSNFDCGGFTDDRIIATWDSYNASAQLLDLRWRYAGTATWLGGVELNTTDTPSYTMNGLDIGTQYELSIQALGLNGAGYSSARNVLGETLFGTRATNVRPTTITERTVTVQWSLATSADVVSQKVYVSWDRGETYRFNTVVDQGPLLGKTVTELLIPSLEPLTDYMFVVETLFVGAGGAIRSLPSRLTTTLGAAPDQVQTTLRHRPSCMFIMQRCFRFHFHV